jgi:hypothetical protein
MKKEKTLKLTIPQRKLMFEITNVLPTSTFGILEEMFDFREKLEIAGPQDSETKSFKISNQLFFTIYSGMNQIQGVIPTKENLDIWKLMKSEADKDG